MQRFFTDRLLPQLSASSHTVASYRDTFRRPCLCVGPLDAGAVAVAPVRVAGWFVGSCGRHWQNIVAALIQVWANKARSLLTTLGIIIAVTSTITVVTLVQGFGNYMTGFLRGLGTNMMFVVPHNPGGRDGRMLGRVLMDIDDVRINVTSAPAGETLPEGTSDSHYGLEHFGFDTDDIEATMAYMEQQGVEVLLPITLAGSGNKISYIKGPDNVRIELVQPQ